VKQIDIQGMKFMVREEGYDDEYTVNEVIRDDCYRVDKKWFKGNTVVDIGSNVGDFSILCAKKFGVKDVMAFEPEPNNLRVLNINNAMNGNLVKVFPYAVGKKGFTNIDDCSGHSQTDRTIGSKVEVVSLNDVLKGKKVDLLKMDCEGGEYGIVEDTKDEIWNNVEMIIGEFHSWRWEDDPERHKKMVKRLEEFFKLEYYGFKDSNFVGKSIKSRVLNKKEVRK